MIKGLRVVASIEARMLSERLPGKVLLECLQRPLLSLLIERVQGSATVDEIVVATTLDNSCDELAAVALASGAKVFRGSEANVSARVTQAMKEASAEIVVQLTGDNPLVDAAIIDQMVRLSAFNAESFDFVTNARVQSYPEGFEVQVMPLSTLLKSDAMCRDAASREHVCLPVHENPSEFRIFDVVAPPDLCRPDLRLSLDTEDDLEVIREIFTGFFPRVAFGCREVVEFLDRAPMVAARNSHVRNKAVR